MSKAPSLRKLLKHDHFPRLDAATLEGEDYKEELRALQLKMLRIQQGLFHASGRAIVLFEGFDASGKGGAIHRLTEPLDPRGFKVHPIGPPSEAEKGYPYLHRFWTRLPKKGEIAFFDRSWYGRVLVEKVEKLAPRGRLEEAYGEIREFERGLAREGIDLIKIFLVISKKEQRRRFEARLDDPYKQWKISDDDLRNRGKWSEYVRAADRMLKETDTKEAPWHLVAGEDKEYARIEVLRIATQALKHHRKWIENATRERVKERRALKDKLG